MDKSGSVLVIGGGIAGMEASLNLANSGFYVYLLESSPAIGGNMAALDKTFPSNDCAMCMISPKLVETGRHPNIEILAYSEIRELTGEAGNFRARIARKPRYVIENKCNACGDCEKACPVAKPDRFNQGLGERKAIYRHYPQGVPNVYTIEKSGVSPCKVNCPASVNVQGYLALIAQKKYQKALDLIREKLPFPGIVGRVCYHPCESECYRKDLDGAVSINDLKRFAVDEAYKSPEALKAEKLNPDKDKVAVIGSGPAGLTAALNLLKQGYRVSVFEKAARPGGMLEHAIPRYRLPGDLVEKEIAWVLNHGIELKTNSALGKDFSLEELKNQGFKAVLLALGCSKSRELEVEGAKARGVLPALEFLAGVNRGEKFALGNKVLVIGGGNVATDCARTALRLGAKEVEILALESRENLPAYKWEIKEVEEEGIKISPSLGIKRLLVKDDKVTGVETLACTQVLDAQGNFDPQYKKGSEAVKNADSVIMAIGQQIEASAIPASVLEAGGLKINPRTLETPIPGVFAAGDLASGPGSVVQAIYQGQKAAQAIEAYLENRELVREEEKAQTAPAPNTAGLARVKTSAMPQLPAPERSKSFAEINLGFSEEEALKAAQRCLLCAGCCECLECEKVCEAKAIDHQMQEEIRELTMGAVIASPGFAPFNAALKGGLGLGRYPDVVTSLQFERILSPSGPYLGKLTCPSDGRSPKKIAFIQCVGSRDLTCGAAYCSSVCCMASSKEAIVAKEHDPELFCTVFYHDLRAMGKNFEDLVNRARDQYGVKYYKALPVRVLPGENGLKLRYEDEDTGEIMEEEFDLVVLGVGLLPREGNQELAGILGINLNPFGLAQLNPLDKTATDKTGIFAAGAFAEPKDIHESVSEASAAAAGVGELLGDCRGRDIKEKIYPQSLDVADQPPRVGVFICHCGLNIASVLDVKELAEFAAGLPEVYYAQEVMYACSEDNHSNIREKIREHNLNRVVVASCTPRTHETLFQETLKEAGINPYLFEMANIREQCSWVHASEPQAAGAKARELLAMAVGKARKLRPLDSKQVPVNQTALVVGGGAAGLTAALSLTKQGFNAVVLEKSAKLGGNLNRLYLLPRGEDAQKYLEALIKQAEKASGLTIHLNSRLKQTSGFVGNFKSLLETPAGELELEHGVIIAANGAREYQPKEFLWGKDARVLTQLELEKRLAEQPDAGKKTYVMMQCVGSRNQEHAYCSRVCCRQAVKNAIRLKEINPENQVYILYRDIRTYGLSEDYYRRAREKGVVFLRFHADMEPQLHAEASQLEVTIYDINLRRQVLIPADLLVLSSGIEADPEAAELAVKLRLSLNQDGFWVEAHHKLRPVDAFSEGIFLCGLAHGPKDLGESITQARAAAQKAAIILSKDHLEAKAKVALVDQELCATCLTCLRICQYQAPFVNQEGKMEINASLCQGCGNCVSDCPAKALALEGYRDEQMLAMLAELQRIEV